VNTTLRLSCVSSASRRFSAAVFRNFFFLLIEHKGHWRDTYRMYLRENGISLCARRARGWVLVNLRDTCYPVKRARFSAPAGASERHDVVWIDAASRCASRGNARARYRNPCSPQTPWPVSWQPDTGVPDFRANRQFFCRDGPAHPRRICASPVQVSLPRETPARTRGAEGRGMRVATRDHSFPREERSERDMSRPSTGFLISRGRSSARRDRDPTPHVASARPMYASWRKHFRQSADV